MPVRKFRSAEEMNQPIWREPGDPALYRAMAGVLELANRTNPRQFAPGITKFQSIEEMTRARDQALAEHVASIATRRRT